MDGGIEVGRWNTWNAGISASMPIVSAQLWQSLKISDQDVEIAVEKARSSRLDMVNQVKQAYFSCLLARELYSRRQEFLQEGLEAALSDEAHACGILLLAVDEAV